MNEHDAVCEVIITAPEPAWLEEVCVALIEGRLAASANIIDRVTSVYRWEERTERVEEARAFLRSRRSLVDSITSFVLARHPYEVPNVTAVPLVGGNPEYLAWVHDQLTDSCDTDRP